MFRLMIKLALLVSVVCIAPIALIRAQPYDDSELRAFLTPPEGCPAPCFMGIRPGVTTIAEAIAILENHAWVENFHFGGKIGELETIFFEWNGKQHHWLRHDLVEGELFVSSDGIVRSLVVKLDYPFFVGDLYARFGPPDLLYLTVRCLDDEHNCGAIGSHWYEDISIEFRVWHRCPMERDDFYVNRFYELVFATEAEYDELQPVSWPDIQDVPYCN